MPVVTEFFKYREFNQQYRSFTGREQKKYAKNCACGLGQYKEYSAKVKEVFPDKKIPTVEYLKERQTKLREQYAQSSAEYNFYKKEAGRLVQQIQKKRQSQKTVERCLQNEQAAKRKKNQLE